MDSEFQKLLNAQTVFEAYAQEIVAELKLSKSRQRFRKNVRLLMRGVRSLTIAQFAQQVGCDASYVCQMLNMEKDFVLAKMRIELIFKIAEVLGTTPKVLLRKDLVKEVEQLIQ